MVCSHERFFLQEIKVMFPPSLVLDFPTPPRAVITIGDKKMYEPFASCLN